MQCKVGLHKPHSLDCAIIISDLQGKGWCLAQLCSLCPLHAGIWADGQPLAGTCCSHGKGKRMAKSCDGFPSVCLQVTYVTSTQTPVVKVHHMVKPGVRGVEMKPHHRAKEGYIIVLQ